MFYGLALPHAKAFDPIPTGQSSNKVFPALAMWRMMASPGGRWLPAATSHNLTLRILGETRSSISRIGS